MFQCERLEELNLSENEIIFLPPAISKLEFLTTLVLSKNCESAGWAWSGGMDVVRFARWASAGGWIIGRGLDYCGQVGQAWLGGCGPDAW